MKRRTILILIAAAAALLPTHAEWEKRPLAYVWTGEKEADKVPEGLLRGIIYDIKRDRKGKLKPQVQQHVGDWWNYVRDDYMETMKNIMDRRHSDIKCNYEYKTPCAVGHLYLQRRYGVNMDGELDLAQGKNTADAASDFISESSQAIPGGWIGVFKGRVTAPKTMKFRFVGSADDTLIVRFGGKVVLESGYVLPSVFTGSNSDEAFSKGTDKQYIQNIRAGKDLKHKDYSLIQLRSTKFFNDSFGGLMGGTPVSVKKGESYSIEIVIGECGRHGFYYLLTQEVTKDNKAPLMLFRTNDDWPVSPQEGEAGPAYSKDSPVWKTADTKSKKKRK